MGSLRHFLCLYIWEITTIAFAQPAKVVEEPHSEGAKVRVDGLARFGLDEGRFRRLDNRKVLTYVYLRTYDVTPAVQRLPPAKRLPYMAARVKRWIERLARLYPELSFHNEKLQGVRFRSELPTTMVVQGPARKILALADAVGVQSIQVTKVAGYHRRSLPKAGLEWYCVRAFVVIRVERQKSGNQMTEDRLVLVRASSFDDAEKRLRQQWREYARPYLNSRGYIVSWQLDKIIDVYATCETEVDPAGFEAYSRLGRRRMRPKYVWRRNS